MHGVIQRPVSGASYVRQRGGQTEVHWHIRPSAPVRRGEGRKTHREVCARDLLEALSVIAALAVLTVLLYVRARQGGMGL